MSTSHYEIPPLGSMPATLHGWLMDAVSEGEAWLTSQRPTAEWKAVVDLLSATDPSGELVGLANTEYNKAKRIARELVAGIGAFRHEGAVAPLGNNDLYKHAHILSQLDRGWVRDTHAYLAYRALLQYAVALGTGYMSCTWDKHFYGRFQGNIRQEAIDPQNVMCIQLPADHDLQRAYAVIIRYELPINLARAIYADTNLAFAQSLRPDRDAPGWITKGLRKVQEIMGGSPALRFAGGHHKSPTSFPTTDVFHMYIMDRSINDSGRPRTMGSPRTNWSYTVPSLGDPIPTGETFGGVTRTRPAQPSDCQLFPLRRLCIFARSTDIICSDATSPWWHGQVPLVKLAFNDWPWESLGSSLVGDIRTIQTGIQNLMRDIEDSNHARLNPARLYDATMVSQGFAQAFNPRMAGVAAAADINAGDPIKFPVPPGTYDVPLGTYQHLKDQESRMDYLTGVQDLTAIAKAKQIPAGDTLEKILEMAGPIVQDLIRAIEDPLQRLGAMRLALNMQFMTTARIIQHVGDEATGNPFTFHPDRLITPAAGESADRFAERRRLFLHEFVYTVSRSGINEINRMTTKLFYWQIMKGGFPLSWWTYADIAEIPNFGPPPTGVNNELERWIAQQHMMRDLATEAAKEQAEATGGVVGADAGATPPAGPAAAQEGPGRPNANTAPPHIESKDGGARSTIATS